jgi:hypothetical protein
MIKIEDYISGECVKEIITFGEHMANSGYSLVGTDGSDIYQSGYFSDENGTFRHVSILGGPEYLKQKVRELRLNKITKIT